MFAGLNATVVQSFVKFCIDVVDVQLLVTVKEDDEGESRFLLCRSQDRETLQFVYHPGVPVQIGVGVEQVCEGVKLFKVKVQEEVVYPSLFARAGFHLGLVGDVATLSMQVTSHDQLHK